MISLLAPNTHSIFTFPVVSNVNMFFVCLIQNPLRLKCRVICKFLKTLSICKLNLSFLPLEIYLLERADHLS